MSKYYAVKGNGEKHLFTDWDSCKEFLEQMKGKMIRLGTDLSAKKSVCEIKNIKNQKKKPVLAVLGNEEHGISDDVRRNCDELVIIPWKGMDVGFESSNVESLNVAQAASIIFYEMCR